MGLQAHPMPCGRSVPAMVPTDGVPDKEILTNKYWMEKCPQHPYVNIFFNLAVNAHALRILVVLQVIAPDIE